MSTALLITPPAPEYTSGYIRRENILGIHDPLRCPSSPPTRAQKGTARGIPTSKGDADEFVCCLKKPSARFPVALATSNEYVVEFNPRGSKTLAFT